MTQFVGDFTLTDPSCRRHPTPRHHQFALPGVRAYSCDHPHDLRGLLTSPFVPPHHHHPSRTPFFPPHHQPSEYHPKVIILVICIFIARITRVHKMLPKQALRVFNQSCVRSELVLPRSGRAYPPRASLEQFWIYAACQCVRDEYICYLDTFAFFQFSVFSFHFRKV